ncbi:MAG TPA: hypothetical protein VM370_12820 [Candidatus Thermoplasmatota archaeon]|nr:hypothetical protein [Candidatus Thermoplasmatota archaeon]
MAPPAPLAPALALVGVLGPALLARGSVPRGAARAFVLAALVGLVGVALWAGLAPGPRAVAYFDVATGGALVALAAVGIARPWALATWLVAGALLGRAAYALTTSPGDAGALAGALFGAAAALLASALATVRFKAPRRSTRA